jgi:hypothetical protein
MRTIPQIDKDITAIRRQLQRLEKIDTMSAASWQNAWDKHPDLLAKENAFYRERYEAQLVRDEKAYKAGMVTARRVKMSLVQEIVQCLELHADYDLGDGFTREEFVEWVMDGIGDDMVREGNRRSDVRAAANDAYDLMSSRFYKSLST